jgi:hypothetical protein
MYSCSCCASSRDIAEKLRLENELQELREYLAFVKARAKAERPAGEIKIPEHFSISRASAKHQYRRENFYGGSDTWVFPAVFYDCGGGCGATGAAGGGEKTYGCRGFSISSTITRVDRGILHKGIENECLLESIG